MKIELKHIHKSFGPVHANNDISVTFNEGKIVGVLGENGAGKSTLMKILSGFQPADTGEIWIDDRHVHYTGPVAAISNGIGMLQQDPLDVGAFTVVENFIYGSPSGFVLSRKEAFQQLDEICDRFNFEIDYETPIDQLSIAQRQQLEIIRLLALNVQTLILDEPTTGISADQKEILFDALHTLAQRDKMTILLVSHKLEDVIALCDEIIVLRAGELVGAMQMPATTQQLVQLMFGEELAPHTREQVAIGQPILQLNKVHLKDARLDMPNISLNIREGEVIGLAGLDGSGQELLMRGCAGLISLQSGSILLEDSSIENLSYRQRLQNGLVFGAAGRLEEGLIAGLTLSEHLALMIDEERFIDWNHIDKNMEQRIEKYDIRGRKTDNIEQLSGGNQQRVLMALLPSEPKVLILEQPTRGLDVDSARWIWTQLLERRKTRTAIVFSSAELDEIVAYSDRIWVFYAGRIHEVADPSQTDIDTLGHLIGGETERLHA